MATPGGHTKKSGATGATWATVTLLLDKPEKTALVKALFLVVHTREYDSVACIYRQRK